MKIQQVGTKAKSQFALVADVALVSLLRLLSQTMRDTPSDTRMRATEEQESFG